MNIKRAVLTIKGSEVVPIRAIPFVTGGDMGPRCLAHILSDPDQALRAYVLGPNNTVTAMLPKSWRQYVGRLSTSEPNAPDLITRATLEILPPNAFVYWEGLWRTHEAYFLPDRDLIPTYSPGEQENFQLQQEASIPEEFVELIFDAFPDPDLPAQATNASQGPHPITTSEIAQSFEGLKWLTTEKWKKPLSDKPKWLEACVATPGRQGTSQTLWNPVLIGAALIHRKAANANQVRGRFQTRPSLQPWLEAWNDYEDDNFPIT